MSQTYETREGSYVARVQTGYEKDGSPKYRYFNSQKEYDAYLRNKSSSKKVRSDSKKQGKKLQDKLEQERSRGKKDILTQGSSKDKQKKNKKVRKSLTLFIRKYAA